MKRNCKGNVLIYVLLAVALLAALTYSISNDNTGTQQNQLTAAQVKLLAGELINHATSAQMAVQQMTAFGVNYEDIKFDLPGTAGYNVDPTLQIYHPRGGGVEVFQNPANYSSNYSSVVYSWQVRNDNNVEWTPTSANDLIYSFWQIDENVCDEINKRLYNRNAIKTDPSFTGFQSHFFTNYSAKADFKNTECPECVGKKSACLHRESDNFTLFYNVIGSR